MNEVLDATSRRYKARVETTTPGQKIDISFSHRKGCYSLHVMKVEIEEHFERFTLLDGKDFSQRYPAPARYSAKAFGEAWEAVKKSPELQTAIQRVAELNELTIQG